MTDLEIFEKFTSLFIDLDDFHYLLTNKPLLAHYTSILESAEFSATLLRLVTCAHSRRARVR
jgi:hypothetical protein